MLSEMTKLLKLIVSRRKKEDGTESRQYMMTVPRVIVEAFGWNEKTRLEVSIEGKGILRVREAKIQ